MVRQKRAFTLVELVLVLLFLGILAFIAVPRLRFSVVSKQKADTTARKIVTDLRRTRSLAIFDAANNTAGFALNMTGAPYSGYEIVNLDTLEVVDSHTIDSGVDCTGGSQFEFGPLGNLSGTSDTQLVVSASEKPFTIDIVSATGMVKCTEN